MCRVRVREVTAWLAAAKSPETEPFTGLKRRFGEELSKAGEVKMHNEQSQGDGGHSLYSIVW